MWQTDLVWVPVPALSHTSHLTLDKSLHLSELRLFMCKNGITIMPSSGIGRINEIMNVKNKAQRLAKGAT